MSRSIQHLIVASLLVLIPSVATRAHADAKVLGPMVCHAAAPFLDQTLEYRVGGITNNSGGAVQIVCSLMRDTVSNTNGLRDLEVAVTDPTGSFSCDAVSEDRNGEPVKVVHRSISGTGNKVLDWSSSLNVSVNRGHYSVSCFLPDKASLHSIYYDENS